LSIVVGRRSSVVGLKKLRIPNSTVAPQFRTRCQKTEQHRERPTTNDQRRSRFPGAITYNALKTKKMQAVWDWPTTDD
jgi:hypothetical protein